MPREIRKRGRRGDKKKKGKAEATTEDTPTLEKLYIEDREGADAPHRDNYDDDNATTFYGLLTEEEGEYFKRADELLAMDQFGDEDGACRAGGGGYSVMMC